MYFSVLDVSLLKSEPARLMFVSCFLTFLHYRGLLVGPSSGAVVKVCADIASRPESEGKTIVGVVASSGIRYVKHPMWEALRTEADTALPTPPDLENEFPILRWKSEDYVPPEK